MLQTLLAERFGLRVRWTTRDQPVYELIAGRRDKRLGPQLKPSTRDCDAWQAQLPREPDGGKAATVFSPKPICGISIYPFRASIIGDTRTMADLARELSRIPVVGNSVLDRTGLTGRFDFELSFAPGAAPGAVGAPEGQPSITSARWCHWFSEIGGAWRAEGALEFRVARTDPSAVIARLSVPA